MQLLLAKLCGSASEFSHRENLGVQQTNFGIFNCDRLIFIRRPRVMIQDAREADAKWKQLPKPKMDSLRDRCMACDIQTTPVQTSSGGTRP
jgi:hypothetical protein